MKYDTLFSSFESHEPEFKTRILDFDPSELTTEQKLALLEAMGIPVDEITILVERKDVESGMPFCSTATLREFIERGKA